MRIVGGTLRGRRLAPLGRGDEAARLRPTADRLRESLFNVLASRYGDVVAGAAVLDLFAGTGALSFEALSRGAERADLFDTGRVAGGLIAKNAALLGLEQRVRLHRRDARRPGPNPGQPATLVFLDPPYGGGLGGPALAACAAAGWIAPEALVVWEEPAPEPPPGFRLLEIRRHGGTSLAFLEYAPALGGAG